MPGKLFRQTYKKGDGMIFKILVIMWLGIIAAYIIEVAAEIRKNRKAIYYFIDKIKEMKNEK